MKSKALYSLFCRSRGTRRWFRISIHAFSKPFAIKHWQGELINGFYDPAKELQLRKI